MIQIEIFYIFSVSCHHICHNPPKYFSCLMLSSLSLLFQKYLSVGVSAITKHSQIKVSIECLLQMDSQLRLKHYANLREYSNCNLSRTKNAGRRMILNSQLETLQSPSSSINIYLCKCMFNPILLHFDMAAK